MPPTRYSSYTVQRRGTRDGLSPEEEDPRLFVAGCERKAQVERLCAALEHYGVTPLFVDNTAQPSYSPELRLVGTDRSLLMGLITLQDFGPGPDSIDIDGDTMDLWWD